MKKIFTTAVLLPVMAFAQREGRVGINTAEPKATLHVKSSSDMTKTQGIVLPHATSAEIDNWVGMLAGTMVYNTNTKCLETYNGTDWVSSCESGSTPIPPTPPTPPSIPATITLKSTSYIIVSVRDNNYLPYTPPTGPASWGTSGPGTPGASPLMEYQGTIPAAGIQIKIPVTTTGSGTLPAYSATINIPKNYTEDNKRSTLTLSWSAQAFTTATTFITATLKPNIEIKVKKLDINEGVGVDGKGVEFAKFDYGTGALDVRAIAGILDRYFGRKTKDYAGSWAADEYEHQFIYLPVTVKIGSYEKVWLTNNLGADYANINSEHFNLMGKKTSEKDGRAYGSLFQWQRKADGHELMKWDENDPSAYTNNNTSVHSSFSTIQANSWYDAGANSVITTSSWGSWVNNSLAVAGPFDLWQAGKANNPCPTGFHVPTGTEFQDYLNALNSQSINLENDTQLALVGAGNRAGNGRTLNQESPYYWASSYSAPPISPNDYPDGITGWGLTIYGRAQNRSMTIRCIQD